MEITPIKMVALALFKDKNVQGRYTRKYAPELVSGFSRVVAGCTLNSFQGIIAYTGMLCNTKKINQHNGRKEFF